MPRTRSAERENERRKQLLIATFAVFAQKGYDQSTLEDIAVKAGFSKAVVLYYFASKEDLLDATFKWIIGDILVAMEGCTAHLSGPVPMLRAQLEQFFTTTRRNRRFYHVYLEFLARSVHNHRYAATTGHFYAGCISALTRTIELGVREGIFSPPAAPDTAASMCGAIMDGLQMQWLFDAEERFDEYRERCWQGWLALMGCDRTGLHHGGHGDGAVNE